MRPHEVAHDDVGTIERVSDADLAMLALDARRGLRNQLGAVLVLGADRVPSLDDLQRLLVRRLAAVPRFGQTIARLPPGAGRPLWSGDPGFRADRQVRRQVCPQPGDETALLGLAARLVARALPADRPLWSVTLVTGLAGGRIAVVLVVHHAVLDGIGGLAVLSRLVDQGGEPSGPAAVDAVASARAVGSAWHRPPYRRLVVDAWRRRLQTLGRARADWSQLRRAIRAGGGIHARRAEACSLLAPTTDRRAFAVARADLARLRAAARRANGTVGEALLAAIAGSLQDLLRARGESVGTLLVSVMVAGRRSTTAGELGNAATPLIVAVPMGPEPVDRLVRIAGTLRAARPVATGPSPLTVLGPVFRAVAALGCYRKYLARQRRFHTLLSSLSGPTRPVTLCGASVEAIVPVAAAEAGNVTVSFLALSYAGELTVTVVADPAGVPDLGLLASALQRRLDDLGRPGAAAP